jgi:hypothetical protein
LRDNDRPASAWQNTAGFAGRSKIGAHRGGTKLSLWLVGPIGHSERRIRVGPQMTYSIKSLQIFSGILPEDVGCDRRGKRTRGVARFRNCFAWVNQLTAEGDH